MESPTKGGPALPWLSSSSPGEGCTSFGWVLQTQRRSSLTAVLKLSHQTTDVLEHCLASTQTGTSRSQFGTSGRFRWLDEWLSEPGQRCGVLRAHKPRPRAAQNRFPTPATPPLNPLLVCKPTVPVDSPTSLTGGSVGVVGPPGGRGHSCKECTSRSQFGRLLRGGGGAAGAPRGGAPVMC